MNVQRIGTMERFSRAVVHGQTVYLAGVVARDPSGGVAEQTRQILSEIETTLGEAGTDKTKILSATIWLSDIASYGELNSVWNAWLAPGTAPARACVEARLASPAYKVEIALIAAI